MFICPSCKELNEEHRKYCKGCGTWLLSTKFPAVNIISGRYKIKRSSVTYKRVPKWLKIVIIVEVILFVLLALLTKLEDFYMLFIFFGLLGFAISFLAIIISSAFRRLRESWKSTMIFFVCSFVLFIAGVVALGNTQSVEVGSSRPVSAKNEQLKTLPSEVVVSQVKISVDGVETKDQVGDSQYGYAKALGVFKIVKLTVTNNQKDAITLDYKLFNLLDDKGREFTYSNEAQIAFLTSLGDTNRSFFPRQLNPGLTVTGYVVFDIPKDAKVLVMTARGGFTGDVVTMGIR